MFKELFTESMKTTQYYFTKDNWEEAAKIAEEITPNSYPLKYSKKNQTVDLPQGLEQKFEKALDKKSIPFDINESRAQAKASYLKGNFSKRKLEQMFKKGNLYIQYSEPKSRSGISGAHAKGIDAIGVLIDDKFGNTNVIIPFSEITFADNVKKVNEARNAPGSVKYTGKVTGRNEVESLLQNYDFYVGFIDDGTQYRTAKNKNNQIVAELKKRGVKTFTNGEYTVDVNKY